jgi:aspartyl-tRNA(Asn)/glutamyl-tRNA(Gln) amidotransferase subunit B
MARSDVQVEVIIGLEIHVQLSTQSKLFCGCAVEFGQPANSRVCPVCLGMPGVLPVMNKKAFEYSVLTGLALNCRIAGFTKWDRKSYYYPDLPKNYQISQYDLPLAEQGFIEIPIPSGQTKRIRIRRVHLEEDAGKNLHATGNFSQVDLNRTGTPLMEIVTEPDMATAAEVRALAVELQRIVRYLGVSEADMQKGHMRFEPNVNLAITRAGQTFKTPIAEVKNLNSFRALEKSVEFETQRQLDEFLETGRTLQMGNKTTRGWDDVHQVTVLQREKEEAHDYRYFPEPDLVPVRMDQAWLEQIRAWMCELPLQRQLRFVRDYGLTDYDAGVLTLDRSTADFFDDAVKTGAQPKRICNLLTQVGLKIANERGCPFADLGLKGTDVASLAEMIDRGQVNASAGSRVLEEMVATGRDPHTLASQLDLLQKSDASELEALVDQVVAACPQALDEIRTGGKKSQKARSFLVGQVMQRTQGRANPAVVSEILARKFGV